MILQPKIYNYYYSVMGSLCLKQWLHAFLEVEKAGNVEQKLKQKSNIISRNLLAKGGPARTAVSTPETSLRFIFE